MTVTGHEEVDLLINYAGCIKEFDKIFNYSPHFDLFNNPIVETPDEDYLEWISIYNSIIESNDEFTMFELGAGYGRWCINAYYALQYLNKSKSTFVAVEVEESHFKFLKEYFEAHGLFKNPNNKVIKAAVDGKERGVFFHMGDANSWYGQYIDDRKVTIINYLTFLVNRLIKRKRSLNYVKTVTLVSLLKNYSLVDLVDMDIQSSELPVCLNSISDLQKNVKRLHISTHSQFIHNSLVELFTSNSWKIEFNYRPFSIAKSPYGDLNLNDGALVVKNLLLGNV